MHSSRSFKSSANLVYGISLEVRSQVPLTARLAQPMDVDVVCDLTESQAVPFVSRFNEDFYVSQTAVENAVRNKSCFNLIHRPTAFKVDVFVSRGRPFDKDSMRRATQEKIGTTRTLEVPIATAEDSIYRMLIALECSWSPSLAVSELTIIDCAHG